MYMNTGCPTSLSHLSPEDFFRSSLYRSSFKQMDTALQPCLLFLVQPIRRKQPRKIPHPFWEKRRPRPCQNSAFYVFKRLGLLRKQFRSPANQRPRQGNYRAIMHSTFSADEFHIALISIRTARPFEATAAFPTRRLDNRRLSFRIKIY
jgi:hypothetical protein